MKRHTKQSHAAYIASPKWKERREQHFNADPYNVICSDCCIPRWLSEIAYGQDLHVHHLTYERVGNEAEDDLETLCARCHEIKTFGRSDLREVKGSTCEFCRNTHWNRRCSLCLTCLAVLGLDGVWSWTSMLSKIDPTCGKPFWVEMQRSISLHHTRLSQALDALRAEHPYGASDEDLPF